MNGEDTGYLIYLALFLVFIGGSFLYSQRDRLGQSAQQAAIWALIFLGAIVAYGFKDTITGQLYPSTALQDGTEITFRKASNGHFHAGLTVNGQFVDFIVDTGATALVLNMRDAARVGINTEDLAFTGTARTANGITRTARVRLDEVRIGSIVDEGVVASVNEGQLDSSLLGMEYLSRFGEIRIAGDTLTLQR